MSHPNDGELYIMLKNVKEDVTSILEQTKITNGRVSSLEKFQSFIMGGLAILSILVIPLLFKIVFNYV